jgi:hypothetical protein
MTPKGLTNRERRALSDFDLAASLDETDRRMLIRLLGESELEEFLALWKHRARPAQLPPPGDWQVWLVMAGRGFRFTDPYDHGSAAWGAAISPLDQHIGQGDGAASSFQLVKYYGPGDDPQVRRITRPVTGSVRVAVNGVELLTGWQMGALGQVVFDTPPADGAIVSAGFAFDVPVRFEEDRLEVGAETYAAGDVASVPLVEVRE